MAIEKKRMQQRYGTYAQFESDKANLLPNEFASVTSGDPNTTDGAAVYFKSGTNDPVRLLREGDAYSQTEMDELLAKKANSGGTINTTSLNAISGQTAKKYLNAYSYAYDAYGRIISYTWDTEITSSSFSFTAADKANRMYICIGSTVSKIQANAFADLAGKIIRVYVENIAGNIAISDTTITDLVTYRQSPLMDFYILASLTRLHREKSDSADIDEKLRTKENRLDLCVTFDKNFIPLTFLDETATTIGAGQFATGNTSIVTAFVSHHITSLQSGAFARCTKLTDLYIDNVSDNITIVSDAVPTTTTIHYLDNDYWSVNNYVTRAVYYLANAKITKDRLSTSLAAEIDGKATQTYVDELADDFTTQLDGKLDDVANSVKETNLNTCSVSSRTIQPNAVTTEKYAERSIQTRHIDESYLDKIEPSDTSGPYHDGNVLITSAAVYNALQNLPSGGGDISVESVGNDVLDNCTDTNVIYAITINDEDVEHFELPIGDICYLTCTYNKHYEATAYQKVTIPGSNIVYRRYHSYSGYWTDWKKFTPAASAAVNTLMQDLRSQVATKADIEIGPEFDYTATYADDAHMTGIYTLMGDLCFIIATAHIKSGWADIDYPLPVAAVVNSACIATDGIKAYRVSTDATQSPTHLYIHTVVEGSYQNEGNISFCLVYRYY